MTTNEIVGFCQELIELNMSRAIAVSRPIMLAVNHCLTQGLCAIPGNRPH